METPLATMEETGGQCLGGCESYGGYPAYFSESGGGIVVMWRIILTAKKTCAVIAIRTTDTAPMIVLFAIRLFTNLKNRHGEIPLG